MQSLAQQQRHIAIPEQDGLDVTRIGAISTALAIHLIAAGLLLAPARVPPQADDRPRPITIVLPAVSQPPPPPVVEPAPVQARVERTVVTPPPTKSPPTSVKRNDSQPLAGSRLMTSVEPSTTGTVQAGVGDGGTATVAEPDPVPPPKREPVTLAGASLAYASNPAPAYPRSALQAGAEGTVILEVTVDEHGKPVAVSIAISSGNRELDRAAREQVLRAWRFHPAMQDGQAVRAIGRVPVAFTLGQ